MTVIVEHLGWTLVHFLWQGALIAILYAIARKCVADTRNAQVRYALGCIALAVMSLAPVVTFIVSGPAVESSANEYTGHIPLTSVSARAAVAAPAPMSALTAHVWQGAVMPWLVAAWLAGATSGLSQ